MVKIIKNNEINSRISDVMPLDITYMTQKQIDKEIMKGIEDLENGRTVSFEEFEEEFKRKYDIRV